MIFNYYLLKSSSIPSTEEAEEVSLVCQKQIEFKSWVKQVTAAVVVFSIISSRFFLQCKLIPITILR